MKLFFFYHKVANKNMYSLPPLVSVIVPVYNGQLTLERTLESLNTQIYGHIEFIFINDASIDNTMDILATFSDSIAGNIGHSVKIISHSENKGVAQARNTGLNIARGEFITFVDADDKIAVDAIYRCVKKALLENADIVYFDWWLSFNKTERKMKQPCCEFPLDAIQAMLAGKMRWNLWMFMVRRSLYERNLIRFLPGANIGEDLAVTIKLFVNAQKIVQIKRALYYYHQDNTTSISKIFSSQHMSEIEINLRETESYLKASRYAKEIETGIHFLKLNLKLPLLTTGIKADYIRWTQWFMGSDRFIFRNSVLPLRTRILQWLAWKRQFWLIRIYYIVVLRFIYRIIYR